MTNRHRIYTYICAAICSLLLPATAKAQLKGVQLSYDVAGTVMRMVSDYGQYEGALQANFSNRYFPIAEIGYGSSEHETDPVTGIFAKANAPYFKLGCDFNIAKNKDDAYRIFVGARYAFTKFDFETSAIAEDPVWKNTTPYSITENGLSYHWAELVFRVDAKVWGPLHLGWSTRYKLKIHGKGSEHGDLWYIPGFGKQGNKIGATFNVGIEL